MREVIVDGSPEAVDELMRALRAALDGSGPAVLPRHVDDRRPPPSATAGALVVSTSGSSGEAKEVLLSADALLASADATHERLAGPGRWLLALPAQHIAGIQVLVRSIVAGHEPSVLNTAMSFRPRVFVEAAAEVLGFDGPHYTALVPTQLSRLVSDADEALAALRNFDAVLVGGAAVTEPLLADALTAGVRVVTTYGMTETAGGCVYDGVPLAGVGVRIGDGGLIELSGPMLADGYLGRPEETAAAFTGGWFHTGDLGAVRADGRLEVLGRADDVINTGGVKVAAAAVEQVLAAQPGVADVCVLGLPDPEWGQLVVAVVVASHVDEMPAAAELRAAVRLELGPRAVPKLVRFLDGLPIRGPGKVDRAAIRALLLDQS